MGYSHPIIGCARRLKRVYSIDVERCDRCGGGVRIIACIEDAQVIEKIRRHLGLEGGSGASDGACAADRGGAGRLSGADSVPGRRR